MSDLQTRLRNASNNPGCTYTNMHLFMDAADQIDEVLEQNDILRAEVAKLQRILANDVKGGW